MHCFHPGTRREYPMHQGYAHYNGAAMYHPAAGEESIHTEGLKDRMSGYFSGVTNLKGIMKYANKSLAQEAVLNHRREIDAMKMKLEHHMASYRGMNWHKEADRLVKDIIQGIQQEAGAKEQVIKFDSSAEIEMVKEMKLKATQNNLHSTVASVHQPNGSHATPVSSVRPPPQRSEEVNGRFRDAARNATAARRAGKM